MKKIVTTILSVFVVASTLTNAVAENDGLARLKDAGIVIELTDAQRFSINSTNILSDVGNCIVENADGAIIGASAGATYGAAIAMTGTQVSATTVGYGAGMSGSYLGLAAFSGPWLPFTASMMATVGVMGMAIGTTLDILNDGCQ